MQFFIGNAVLLDVLVDVLSVIAVVAQCIEHLGEGQVRKAVGDSSGKTPARRSSTTARTGVRVPSRIGSPLKMSSSVTT